MNGSQNPRPANTATAIDLSLCEAEPIHIPGAIQPHGALVAVSADTQLVTHASANLQEILGLPPEAVLGRGAAEVFDEPACRVLFNAGPDDRLSVDRVHPRIGPIAGTVHLHAYRTSGHICVDIEPVFAEPEETSPVAMARSAMESFSQASGRGELCQRAVDGLRAITGFDRVMAYRFHPDGHGEVIAESRVAHIESYLGLHYPASDIPPSARRLILRQRVGAIADTAYIPVPLLADPALDDGTPLDLTHSALRSVSPIHREYLRNMKVAACLTIALVNGQDFWGMIVCHQAMQRVAGPELRAVAGMVGEVVSLLLGSLGQGEVYAQRLARGAALRAVSERLFGPLPLPEAFAAAETELLALVGAAGAMVQVSGANVFLGRTPPPPIAERALAVMRSEIRDRVLAIDDLGLRHPELAGCISEGSGALLLPFGEAGGDGAILWFRPEVARTVVWGGNPDEHAIADPVTGRLSPRASFTAWRTTAHGRSEPWTEVDLALCRALRRAVEAAVAHRTKLDLAWIRHHDPLTRLPNRRLLRERLAEADLETEAPVTLIYLDLVFNLGPAAAAAETPGYSAGDAILLEAVQRLLDASRPEDFVARLDGNEFVVVCPGLAWRGAAELGERIRQAIEAPIEVSGQTCQAAVRIGIAAIDRSISLDMVHAAHMAMHAAMAMIETNQKANTQRQKMEALGRMVGGVAHEINNMLLPIVLLGEIIADNGALRGEDREHLGTMLDCGKSAKQIIVDLLAFSGHKPRTVEFHDSVLLLQDSLRLVRHALPARIALNVRIEGQPPKVAIDRATFTQILLNLVTNAAAAMDGEGELAIVLENDPHGPGDTATRQPARFGRLRVVDTGHGMDKLTLDRAFEPFFTTKPIGQGTGLGLPVVYGMIRELGGTIALASEPGRGTTATIWIPADNGELGDGIDTGG